MHNIHTSNWFCRTNRPFFSNFLRFIRGGSTEQPRTVGEGEGLTPGGQFFRNATVKIRFPNLILSDGSYYLSIPNAMVNCPLSILTIMLMFNIVAIYKDWSINKKIFETYRSIKTGDLTIDPLNGVTKDQLEKERVQ